MKEALRLAALLAGMSGLLSASSTKTMLNGGQFGVATAAAAFLCKKHNTTPRGVYEKHLAELQDIVFERGEHANDLKPQP